MGRSNTRILFLIGEYRPDFGPRYHRWSALIGRLRAENVEVDIVDRWGPVRAEGLRSERLSPEQKLSRGPRQVKEFLKFLVFPDNSVTYLPTMLGYAWREARRCRPDIIVSTGLPVVPMLVGALLKSFGVCPRFILEYSDPYSYSPLYRAWNRALGRLDGHLDRFLIRQADLVSVHTPSLRETLIDTGVPPDKVVLTRHFFDFQKAPVPAGILGDHAINVVFAGTFYEKIGSPQPLLKAVERTPNARVRLYLAGKRGDCWDMVRAAADRCPRIKYLGYLPREQILSILADADYCINMCTDSMFQMPSKLNELLLMNGRVINIYHHQQQLIEVPEVINVRYGTDTLQTLIDGLPKPCGKPAGQAERFEKYEQFCKEQTALFLRMFKRALAV